MTKNLDNLDKKILCQLDLDARLSANKIAKKLNVSKETINFRINRLQKNNIIKGFYPMIDNSKINQFFYKIFIKFKELNPNRRNEILEFLANYPKMAQVLLLEGKFDVQLFFLAKNKSNLMELMNQLNNFCGKEIKDKEIVITDSLYRFNLKLFPEIKEDIKIKVKSEHSNYKLDKTSQKVLSEISKDARTPITEIAKRLNISAQLAQYHLKKLIKDKVILSTHFAINYETLNMQHYHLTFQVNNHKVIQKIIEFFRSKRKSIFATTSLGYYDCSTELFVKDNEELRTITDELLSKFAEEINEMDVLFIFKEYQLRLYPI
jgi:DNA-binding Lrp family transcriptional regulator